jgi:UDP-2,3-diacylglucosamine pyrophosphatase LpxH
MIPLASFDQISVISDLHLGGPPNRQIFRQGQLLADFIDYLRSEESGNSALVINGDMVDFLAHDEARYFDPEGAVEKLDSIIADDAFSPVWRSLTEFVKSPKRWLAITLGNHDLELALPWVRDRLLHVLSGGDPVARARILLSFDGAGFACTVGGSRVLCLHGNEVDAWNVTDYEALRRIVCDLVQGRYAAEWTPNAGSKLVIDVMNKIKSRHAFVDLLKPEKEAAVRILVVLRPEYIPALRQIAAIASRRVWDGARRAMNLLSEAPTPEERAEEDALARIVGRAPYVERDVDALMNDAETQFKSDRDPLEMVYDRQGEQLGWWSALASAARGREDYEIAWAAIKELASDETFEIRRTDEDFDRIDKLAGSNFNIVVAGHTHLARAIGRASGGMYYNCGTWASLMRLRPEQLASPETFKPVYDILKAAQTIDELEKVKVAFRRPTVVTIRAVNGKVEPSINTVTRKDGKITLGDPGGEA